MSVIVKVFFERTDGSVEIRRFIVNTTYDDFFATTKEKIKQLYTVLTNSSFTLYWKDPDGDLVAFSTLEEMKDALTFLTDGVFRVYVYEGVKTLEIPEPQNEKSPGSQQLGPHHLGNSQPSVRITTNTPNQSQPQGLNQNQSQGPNQNQSQGSNQSQPQPGSGHTDEPVHPGIYCNGCQGPVKGIRYKCCVCPDFDLCQMCECKGVHSEHDMYKINYSRNCFRLPPFLCQPVFSYHSGQHPVFIHHGFSAPGAHAGASACFSSSIGSIPGPFRGFPPGPPQPVFTHPPGFNVPGASDARTSFGGSCGVNRGGTSFGGSCGVNPGGTSFGGSCGVNPGGTSFGGSCGSNSGMSGGTNTDQKDKKNGQPSADDLFNQNEPNISALLDHFGIKINFDTHADTGAPQQESNQFTRSPMGSGFAAWENMFRRASPSNTTGSGQTGAASRDSNTPGTPWMNASGNSDGNVPEDAGVKVNAETRSSDQTNAPEDFCEFRIPSSVPIPLPGPTSNPAPTTSSASAPSAKQTQPAPAAASQNSDLSTASAGTPGAARPHTNLYPNLQVQQSLEQMLAMGFSDTDGCLTALLTENDGNIGVTLDAIMVKATEQLGNLHGGH